MPNEYVNCPQCDGLGLQDNQQSCLICDGFGMVREHEAVKFVDEQRQHELDMLSKIHRP